MFSQPLLGPLLSAVLKQVSTYNMVVLSEVHDRVGAHSFGGLGRAAFGRYADCQ